MISLLPIDVGFDPKQTAHEIVLPKDEWIRVRYIDGAGFARDSEMSYDQARHVLKRAGYKLADRRKRTGLRVAQTERLRGEDK